MLKLCELTKLSYFTKDIFVIAILLDKFRVIIVVFYNNKGVNLS